MRLCQSFGWAEGIPVTSALHCKSCAVLCTTPKDSSGCNMASPMRTGKCVCLVLSVVQVETSTPSMGGRVGEDEGLEAQAPGSERQWGASQVQTNVAQVRRHCQQHVAAPPANTHHRHFILHQLRLRQWCADTLSALRPAQLTHLMGNKMRSCAGASQKF